MRSPPRTLIKFVKGFGIPFNDKEAEKDTERPVSAAIDFVAENVLISDEMEERFSGLYSGL